jgi:small subunit ribosomal protein S9
MAESTFYGTGKRKTSIARVWLMAGDGKIRINKKGADEYLGRETLKMIIQQPFEVTGTTGQFDVRVNVNGGGVSGQAGAIKHGISRALLQVSDEHRKPLKKAGYLTRDAREVERKKYGQRGARARFQFSKR